MPKFRRDVIDIPFFEALTMLLFGSDYIRTIEEISAITMAQKNLFCEVFEVMAMAVHYLLWELSSKGTVLPGARQ